MDRILRRQLDAIARDNHSGAAELTLQASESLQSWLRRSAYPPAEALGEIARGLQDTKPVMAPLWRLANEVALSADRNEPTTVLRRRISAFSRRVRTAPSKIATQFVRILRAKPDNLLLTYSYSSTVAKALVAARAYVRGVYCSESRPAREGRAMARILAAAGIQILFCSDADLLSDFGLWRIAVLGADAVLPHTFLNKVGTDVLIANATKRRARVFVLADTTKFWPDSMFGLGAQLRANKRDRREFWSDPPRGVSLMMGTFGSAPIPPRAILITERGPMTPPQMRRMMRRIHISPRLAMVDWLRTQIESLAPKENKTP